MKRQIFLSVKFEGNRNREIVETIETSLKNSGWHVFLPVRDVSAWGVSGLSHAEMMVAVRRGMMTSCFIVADATIRGHGIAAEIGMAFALMKPVIIFRVDATEPLSESLRGMASSVVEASTYDGAAKLVTVEVGRMEARAKDSSVSNLSASAGFRSPDVSTEDSSNESTSFGAARVEKRQ